MARWTRAARRATVAPPPLRAVSRSSDRPARKRGEHGSTSMPEAYARVALAVGLSTDDVRRTWLAAQKHEPPEQWSTAHMRAVDMLSMSEATLAATVARAVVHANAQYKMADGPRFLTHVVWNSEHSPEGWPDYTLLDRKLPHLYLFELKRESYGPTPSQVLWLTALDSIGMSACGCAVTVLGVIRPSNMHLVKQALEIA